MVPILFVPVVRLMLIADDQAEKSMKSRVPAPASVKPVSPAPAVIAKTSSPAPVVTFSTEVNPTKFVVPREALPAFLAVTLTLNVAV